MKKKEIVCAKCGIENPKAGVYDSTQEVHFCIKCVRKAEGIWWKN